jgi:hypothetical protein
VPSASSALAGLAASIACALLAMSSVAVRAAPTSLETSSQAIGMARAQLAQRYADARELRGTDPARYFAETHIVLESAQRLLRSPDIHPDDATLLRDWTMGMCREVAVYARFASREPARAAAFYARAIDVSAGAETSAVGLAARLGLADTLRFDLADPRAAVGIYEDLRARDPRRYGEWLGAEIAYLRQGTRYAGSPSGGLLPSLALDVLIDPQALSSYDPAIAALVRARWPQATDPQVLREIGDRLDRLSPSQQRLVAGFTLLPTLGSAERVAAFMRRHDPAGYLTATAVPVWSDRPGDDASRALAAMWSQADRAMMRDAGRLLGHRSE